MKKSTVLLILTSFLLWCGSAWAVPISYQGTMYDGVVNNGAVSSAGHYASPESAYSDYWTFYGNQGDTVRIQVARLETNFDPGMWIFEGTFSDSSEFGSSIGWNDPGFLDWADDEIPAPGPWGDPLSVITLTLPGTGTYTAIVTDVLSGWDGGDGFFDYTIQATGVTSAPVPEPATLFLVSTGLVGLFGYGRKKSISK